MSKKEIMLGLIDDKKAAILTTVLNSRDELCLKEIAIKSNVSLASTFRILNQLVELGILKRKEWKNSKVYLPEDNKKTRFLADLFEETYNGLAEFVKLIDDVTGLNNIILHGKQDKNKANVLLIGQAIDADSVELACQKVRGKGFDLSYLTLTKEQYDQMAKMGLYSGEKKVLK